MPLNSEQREAVRLIKEWELINTDRYFILDGAAGVGKTYTLSQSGLRFSRGRECPTRRPFTNYWD